MSGKDSGTVLRYYIDQSLSTDTNSSLVMLSHWSINIVTPVLSQIVSCADCVWRRLCLAQIVSGADCVWRRLCLAQIVSGADCVWRRLCLAQIVSGADCVWRR